MITHQGSKALNQTISTHAPYSTKATNQVARRFEGICAGETA